jgi:hypothetical protein
MNEDNMQEQSVDMTPEEAKASLGLATRLSEQMLMAQMAQTGGMQQGGEQAPQEQGDSDDMDVEEQDKEDKGEDKTDEKMEILRTELKDTIKMEVDSIKQMIKDALDNEKDNGEN